MKKLFTFLAACMLISAAFLPRQAGAQSPEKMSYQAVIRNSSNQLVTNHAVGMKISILQGSASGSPVYVETQTPIPNVNGLVTVEIGSGTLISGSFSSIDWSDGPYFIKTETDPAGGSNYAITGTSQLLSVPYALYAKTSGNGSNPSGSNGYIQFNNSGSLGSDSKLYWDNINKRLGLGTTSPAFNLTISGGALNTALGFTNNYTGISETDGLRIGVNADTANTYIWNYENSKLYLGTNNKERITILGNGRVGIGTNNPIAKFEVKGGAVINGDLWMQGKNISSLAKPSNPQDAANKAYVDSVFSSGTHFVGESYGGGIVFYVYDNGRHGLIAAKEDQSAGTQWYNGIEKYTGSKGNGVGAGEMNTALIVAAQIGDNQIGNFAAQICADYSNEVGGVYYGDWYLPSDYELIVLYNHKDVVGAFTSDYYWSSTELNNFNALSTSFSDGIGHGNGKSPMYRVRAIRAF